MDKRQLRDMMPVNKLDVDAAKRLTGLKYAETKTIAFEMLQLVRLPDSPVATVFVDYFIRNADLATAEVSRALSSSRPTHLKYVISRDILPQWPRSAIEAIAGPLVVLVTATESPETALMAIQLLASHDLGDREWLRRRLDFIEDRMARNMNEARAIKAKHF